MQEDEFRALVKAAVEHGRTLEREEAREALLLLLGDPGAPLEPSPLSLPLAALLAAMAGRGETAGELCGFAEAMRATAHPLPLREAERARIVDTCGTGGDGLDTFNISTAAGLVAAGAGAWVAKHGNRAVTSRCGSADVLEALGVPIALAPAAAAECLRATGFVFMLATGLHPAMRRVAPVRRAMPFRTIFNLAGPLANPAGARAQVVGVYAEARVPVVAEALALLGTRHALVVHGRVPELSGQSSSGQGSSGPLSSGPLSSGLDELTVTGDSVLARVEAGMVRSELIAPETLGLPVSRLAELRGGADAQANAALVEAVLRGKDRGARRDIVLLNAAAALLVAGLAQTLAEGLEQAATAVRSGAAWAVVEALRAFGASAA